MGRRLQINRKPDNPPDVVKSYFSTYRDDAVKIANVFQTSVLTSADKESIALEALLRAARRYNPTKLSTYTNEPTKFSSVLYQYVYGSLVNAKKRTERQKRIPLTKLVNEEQQLSEMCFNIFSIIGETSNPEESFQYKELLSLIRQNLSESEWTVLNLMLNPQQIREEYKNYGFDKVPDISKATYDLIGKALRVSRQRIHQIILSIRIKADRIIKNFDSQDFKVR